MKTRISALLGLVVLSGLVYAQTSTANKATIDKPVSDFKLKDVMHDTKDGDKPGASEVALVQFKEKKPVVLFFMSERCGTTWRYEKRLGKLMKDHSKDVAFLGIRCSANDTSESIRKFAETRNFAMPVLNDEKGEVTSYYKVTNTPTFVLLDKEGVMRYRGSFDDNADESAVKDKYLLDAITAVLSNKVVAMKMTRPFG
jgi:peroxiredoxin